MAMESPLPRVDWADPRHLEILAKAVSPEGPGFFYLKFPDATVEQLAEDTLQLSREFFALPLAEKEVLKNDLDACYWVKDAGGDLRIPSTGAGYRAVSEDSNFAGDMRESFNLRMPKADLSTELCGLGENKWPQPSSAASKLWCERFAMKSSEYFQVCFKACTRLRKSLADLKCLGPFLCSDSASDDAFTRSTSLLGFTHYNYNFRGGYGSSSSNGSDQVFGIRPHQDDGMCTLLYTDGQPGLEYAKGLRAERSEAVDALGLFSGERCRNDAQFSSAILWEPVPFLPGHWIVNLGTDLFRWTQQRSAEGKGCKPSKATLHRVIPMGIPGCPKGGLERYSMPFFYEANLDTPDPCFPYKKRYEYLIEEAGDKIKRTHVVSAAS